jgi:hypothetical protein
LGKHEATQFWPKVTINADRQWRRHHAAIRRLPALAAEIHNALRITRSCTTKQV